MFNLISKNSPPHVAFRFIGKNHNSCNVSDGAHSRAYRLFLCIVAVLLLPSCGKRFTDDGRFFDVDRNIYANADSLHHYARLAYLNDDPHALCITAVAAYYYANDSAAHDTLPLVSLDEADIMLLHAANDLHYRGAYDFIYMLDRHNNWQHSLPEIKE